MSKRGKYPLKAIWQLSDAYFLVVLGFASVVVLGVVVVVLGAAAEVLGFEVVAGAVAEVEGAVVLGAVVAVLGFVVVDGAVVAGAVVAGAVVAGAVVAGAVVAGVVVLGFVAGAVVSVCAGLVSAVFSLVPPQPVNTDAETTIARAITAVLFNMLFTLLLMMIGTSFDNKIRGNGTAAVFCLFVKRTGQPVLFPTTLIVVRSS